MAEKVEYIITLRDRVTKTLKGIDKQFNKTQKTATSLGSAIARIGATIGVAKIGKQILQLGMNMEQTRVAFATFLGDAEKANQLIDQLNEFANVTPFDNAQVIASGRVLLAAGTAAEDVTDRLKMVGDVASGANVPLNEMANIYAKAMNKGRVQAQELNQLAERGVPILATFADMFGITTEEVMEMGSRGELTADLLTEAFRRMTGEGGMFFDMMEKQSETAAGKFSTILGKLQTQGIQMGEKILPTLTKALGFVVDNFDQIVRIITRVIKVIALYRGALFATRTAVRAATIAHNAYRFAIIATTRGLRSAIVAVNGLRAALIKSGVGALVVGIGFLIEKIISWTSKTREQTDAQKELNEEIQKTQKQIEAQKFTDFTSGVQESLQRAADLGIITHEQAWKDSATQLEFYKKALANLPVETLRSFENILIDQAAEAQRQLEMAPEHLKNVFQESLNLTASQLRALQGVLSAMEKRRAQFQRGAGEEQTETTTTTDRGAREIINSITGAAPKTFNIAIENLIENFSIETTNLQESATEIRRAVTLALNEALADTELITQ